MIVFTWDNMSNPDIPMVIDDDEENGPPKYKSQLPWVEKYRPNTLSELIAHEEIIQILNKLIDTNKLPHLLFHGPPGF